MTTTVPVTIEQIAPTLAEALTIHTAGRSLGSWTAAPSDKDYDNPHDVWYLRRTDGATLRLTLAEHTAGRLIISGEVPDTPEGVAVTRDGLARGKATADPSRKPRLIAQQIIRTVLPVLDESTATLHKRVAEARRLQAEVEDARRKVASVAGFEADLYWQGDPRGTYQYAATPSASLEIRSDCDGAYVNITARGLPVDLAVSVLRALTAPTA